MNMQITTNESGTRTIEISEKHLDTIARYQLFRNLIDSNGIIDENVLEKLRMNVRSLLENSARNDRDLLSLCFDVIYHQNMKVVGLHNLIILYNNHITEDKQDNAAADWFSPDNKKGNRTQRMGLHRHHRLLRRRIR